MKPLILGLTGQTGAGKTTVSNLFAEKGFAVINADLVARQVVEKDTPCLAALVQFLGEVILLPDGSMNRKAVAAIVFGDENKRSEYQALIFPYIRAAIEQRIQQLIDEGRDRILLDAPTLFESGCNRLCDAVVSVIAPKEIRFDRICRRDALTEQQAQSRMAAQLSEEYFVSHSQAVIRNEGSLLELQEQTLQIIDRLLSEYTRR